MTLKTNHDSDFYAWSLEQSNILTKKDYEKLDIKNLIDEVLSLGNSEKNKLESHLAIWLMHELKIRYQPEKHTRSWDISIKNAKYQFFKCLKKNPSLNHGIEETLQDAYQTARWRALGETDLLEQEIPEECIFKMDWVMEGEN